MLKIGSKQPAGFDRASYRPQGAALDPGAVLS